MAKVLAINEQELRAVVLKFRALGELAKPRERKAILRKGAKILEAAAKANVPIAAEPYTMYRRGEAVASILPGFVRDAMQVRNLRKSPDLWVGIQKLSGILAFWAQWLEFGATNRDGSKREGFAFMRRAVASTKAAVIAQIISDTEKAIAKILKRIKN